MKPNQYFNNIRPKADLSLDELLERRKILAMDKGCNPDFIAAEQMFAQADNEGDYWKFLMAADMYDDLGLSFTAGRCLEKAGEQSRYDHNKPNLERDFCRQLYGEELKNPLERSEPVPEEPSVWKMGILIPMAAAMSYVVVLPIFAAACYVKSRRAEKMRAESNVNPTTENPVEGIFQYKSTVNDGGVRM